MMSAEPEAIATIDVSLRILFFVVLVVANAEMLVRYWKTFWAAK